MCEWLWYDGRRYRWRARRTRLQLQDTPHPSIHHPSKHANHKRHTTDKLTLHPVHVVHGVGVQILRVDVVALLPPRIAMPRQLPRAGEARVVTGAEAVEGGGGVGGARVGEAGADGARVVVDPRVVVVVVAARPAAVEEEVVRGASGVGRRGGERRRGGRRGGAALAAGEREAVELLEVPPAEPGAGGGGVRRGGVAVVGLGQWVGWVGGGLSACLCLPL